MRIASIAMACALFLAFAPAVHGCGADNPVDDGGAAGDAGGTTDTGGGDAGATDASREEELRGSVRLVCEKLEECSPTSLEGGGGDVDMCVEREYETMLPVLDLPGLKVDMAACVKAISGGSCSDFFRMSNFEASAAGACEFAGSLADGEPCVYPYQCASRLCGRPMGTSCGTCMSPLETGAACGDWYNLLGSRCGFGSGCHDGVCTPKGDEGDPCDAKTAPCFVDLACIGGICSAPAGRRDPCTALVGECDINKEGLVCDPGTKRCVAVTFAKAGEECGFLADGPVACAGGGCYPSVAAGTCVAWAVDGAACDDNSGPGCWPHAQCVNGVCEQYFTPVCE
ncbi:MAG: hypothetical protein HY897_10865 [Deltaproteobacteria bacterium]|nr:hypothetical protein [Deltaproteobacteria bacterium]